MSQTNNNQTDKNERRKRRKRKILVQKLVICLFSLVIGIIVGIVITRKGLSPLGLFSRHKATGISTTERLEHLTSAQLPDWVDVQLIPVDGVSRDATPLGGFNDIVIHYVGNPGTSAQDNHDYYCNPESSVSSHFIVGLDGEIIQCIPLNEMSAASNWRNRDTISIEVCHPDISGKFTQTTYDSLVKLTAWLKKSGRLDDGHIIRHYDITGKECPSYYVEHPDAWEDFLRDVNAYK